MDPSLVLLAAVAVAFAGWALVRRGRSEDSGPRWGAAIDKERNFVAIASAFRAADAAGDERIVSDRTWRDLSLDAVFARLDRCVSGAGQQALYRRLRRPSFDPDAIAAFDRNVVAFERDASLRETFRRAVLPLSTRGTLDLGPLLHGAPPARPRGARFFPLATLATVVAAALSVVWPVALFALIGCVVGSIAIRLHLHHAMGIHANALGSIARLITAAKAASAIVSPALSVELAAMRAALSDVASYASAVRWLSIDATQTEDIIASAIAYANVILLVDVNAYARSLDLLRRHGPQLATLFDTLGDLDAARSVASFRASTVTAQPTFLPAGAAIDARGVRHPLLEEPVPNDVLLEREGCLVMGSNMAGKSTFLRAVALQAILAQAIGTVTASSYAAPCCVVRTSIHIEDDLLAGQSHFLAEAEASCEMLLEGGPYDRLCIVDELFRGTNTADRVAAGTAFLRALKRRGAFVVAATHDAELVALLADDFSPHYFQEIVTDDGLVFDYRIRRGPVAPRNALAVLKLVGFPEDVLADARKIALT